MPHRRRVQKGSFGSHLDELVGRFPADKEAPDHSQRSEVLQERIDIHALLFERAWKLDQEQSS